MAQCEVCGTELVRGERGRIRRTCSAACRQLAYRRRHRNEVATLRAVAGQPTVKRSVRAVLETEAERRSRPTEGPRVCPISDALSIVGERWTLLVVREVSYGVHRFEQIVEQTGASRDILADRLRKLEMAGIIERRAYSEHPPRAEYHLTADAGVELFPVLLSLAQWGRKWATPAA
jgi:DNA-binding HxlR family transcriptional regulator